MIPLADSDATSTVDIVSLTVSGLAFVTALAALAWTVYEWHRSGARLQVSATSFVILGHPLIGDANRWMVAISVTNSGRTATTVSSLGFKHPDYDGVMTLAEPAAGPNPIPKRLDTGESFEYPIEVEELIEKCFGMKLDPLKLRPYANCGHGRFDGKFAKVGLDIVRKRIRERVAD